MNTTTRRSFLAASTAAMLTPRLALGQADAFPAWLARQTLGQVYYAQVRAPSAARAEALLQALTAALEHPKKRHEHRYGAGQLRSIEYEDGLHVDVVVNTESTAAEVTLRGNQDSATYTGA